jgi:coenzyme Q-binding protein COQ10
MPSFSTRHRVPFTPQQMFDLVADVESYPQFVPLCESITVTKREAHADHTVLVARMEVGYKALRESFTTKVLLEPDRNRILVEYLDGPFRHLENRWQFDSALGCCDVDFYITYEFKSLMLSMLMGGLFDQAFRKFTRAFEDRARKIYGPADLRAPA